MISLFLASIMAVQVVGASEAPCSESPANNPCTPDPGASTDKAKEQIRRLIVLAGTAQSDVDSLRARFIAIRQDPGTSIEQKFTAFEAYRTKKLEQDRLYNDVIEKTAALYHVQPANVGPVAVARSSDPQLAWMSGPGLKPAHWDPAVTDSGKDVRLAFKVAGSDRRDHYGGLVQMDADPLDPTIEPRYAVTLPDGRTLVLRGAIELALQKKHGLGFLASVIFHETRHFNYLSRPCPNGSGTCSWASETEDERDAYAEQNRLAKAFELNGPDRDAFIAQWRAFDADVKAGRLSFNPEPKVEAAWEDYYKDTQINLEDEYAALKKQVEDERRRQQKEQDAAARRRQAELDRENAKAAMMAEVLRQIDACGFGSLYRDNGHTFVGFRAAVNGWPSSYAIAHPMTLEEFKTGLMFARACLDVTIRGFDPAEVRPCNDGADIAAQHWDDAAFRSDAQFRAAPEQQVRCLRYVYDHWKAPMTDKLSAKIMAKARDEYRKAVDEKWRREEREREAAEEDERERRAARERPERPEPEDRRSPTPRFHCGFNSGGAYCD